MGIETAAGAPRGGGGTYRNGGMGASAPIISSSVIFMGNHSKIFDVPGGFTPATGASPRCDNDVLPVTNFVNIAMRPRPLRGTGGAKGAIIIMKNGFLPGKKRNKPVTLSQCAPSPYGGLVAQEGASFYQDQDSNKANFFWAGDLPFSRFLLRPENPVSAPDRQKLPDRPDNPEFREMFNA